MFTAIDTPLTLPSGKVIYVRSKLGEGGFSFIYKASDSPGIVEDAFYAIKVSEDNDDSRSYIEYEASMMQYVKDRVSKSDYLRICSYETVFYYQNRVIIVMEYLYNSLFDILVERGFNGFRSYDIHQFLGNVLEGVRSLHRIQLVHTDIKPQNILLVSKKDFNVKVADFGTSFALGTDIVYPIQTLNYRAPETILHLPLDEKIDMWSCGCLAMELFNGSPLFIVNSEQNMICSIKKLIGDIPAEMVDRSPVKSNFFVDGCLLSPEEFQSQPNIPKFKTCFSKLPNFHYYFDSYHISPSSRPEFIQTETHNISHLHSLVSGLLEIDPRKRLSAEQALSHPFFSDFKKD